MKKVTKKNNNGCSDICYDVCNDRSFTQKEAFKILKTNATIYSSKTMENRRCATTDELIAYIGKRKRIHNTKVATVKIKDNGYAPKKLAQQLLL